MTTSSVSDMALHTEPFSFQNRQRPPGHHIHYRVGRSHMEFPRGQPLLPLPPRRQESPQEEPKNQTNFVAPLRMNLVTSSPRLSLQN